MLGVSYAACNLMQLRPMMQAAVNCWSDNSCIVPSQITDVMFANEHQHCICVYCIVWFSKKQNRIACLCS